MGHSSHCYAAPETCVARESHEHPNLKKRCTRLHLWFLSALRFYANELNLSKEGREKKKLPYKINKNRNNSINYNSLSLG